MAMMKTVVTMDAAGRLTLPADARRELGIEGATHLELDVAGHGIVLRPLSAPDSDAGDEPTALELARVASQGRAFAWLDDEPDLYSAEDGEPV